MGTIFLLDRCVFIAQKYGMNIDFEIFQDEEIFFYTTTFIHLIYRISDA